MKALSIFPRKDNCVEATNLALTILKVSVSFPTFLRKGL
jgi:hypothetical protein